MEQMSAYEIAKALNAEYHGEDVAIDHISTYSRDLSGNCLFVALEGERTDGHRYVAAALRGGARLAAVQKPVEGLTPEEESRLLRVENTFYAPLAIAAAYRKRYSLLTVGVTGSVGKTTTKDFIAAVLSARYKTLKSQGNHNNEFGLPVTVFELDPSYHAGVFEMGMDARGDISRLTAVVKPDIGVITNVGVSHLERLGTRENILAAKLEIAEGMADGSPLILCGDNDLLSTVEIPRLRVLRYGIEAPELDARAEEIVTGEGETRFVIVWKGGRYPARIPAMGRHNAMNALAGFLVGIEAGMTPEEAAEARLAEYGFTDYRVVGEGDTVTDQTPLGGAIVPNNAEIILYMGEEKPDTLCSVPYVVGMSASKANEAITNAGLIMKVTGAVDANSSTVIAISQNYAEGTQLEAGSVVEVRFGDTSVRD